MKLLFFICLSFISISQDTLYVDSLRINSNNSISGMYNYNNNIPIMNLTILGDNSFSGKLVTFSTNTAYTLQYNNTIIANELQQKTNINYNNLFLIHVFNHSLSRNIEVDNSYGFGIGKWWNYGSISYALLYQNSRYNNGIILESYRHSLRLKLKYDHRKFGISYEYYFQPNLKDFKDNIIYGNIKINFLNHKKINYTISDNINYRSLSNVKLIHNLTLGINLTFNKN
jgi:hypothetical protein